MNRLISICLFTILFISNTFSQSVCNYSIDCDDTAQDPDCECMDQPFGNITAEEDGDLYVDIQLSPEDFSCCGNSFQGGVEFGLFDNNSPISIITGAGRHVIPCVSKGDIFSFSFTGVNGSYTMTNGIENTSTYADDLDPMPPFTNLILDGSAEGRVGHGYYTKDDSDSYQVEVSTNGNLTILAVFDNGGIVEISNSNTVIATIMAEGTEFINASIPCVAAGDIFNITVTGKDNECTSYEISEFVSVSELIDQEPNDNNNTATLLQNGQTAYGNVGYGYAGPDAFDVYEIVAAVGGTLQIDATFLNSGEFTVNLSDSNTPIASANSNDGETATAILNDVEVDDVFYINVLALSDCTEYDLTYSLAPIQDGDLEPNNSFGEAVTLYPDNEGISGSVGGCATDGSFDNIDYYLIAPTQEGDIDINADFGTAQGVFEVCDKNGNCSENVGIGGTFSFNCIGATDTFYVSMRPVEGECLNYDLSYQIFGTPNYVNDIEPNNTQPEATFVDIFAQFSGTVGYGFMEEDKDEEDWFAFAIPLSGFLNIEVDITGTGSICLYAEDGSIINCAFPDGGGFPLALSANLFPGNYYLSIKNLDGSSCLVYNGYTDFFPNSTVSVTCPEDISVETTGSTATVSWIEPLFISASTKETLEATQIQGLPSGSEFPIGTSMIVYQATQGNEVFNCTFEVEVISTGVSSVITMTCPSDQTISIPPGTTSQIVEWTAPTASTDCMDGSDITITQTTGSPNGSLLSTNQDYLIEYTFTDDCGSTTSCDFNINFIEEALEYEISCTEDINRTIASSENGVIVDYDLPVITSNCANLLSEITLISGAESGSFFGIGTTTITYQINFDCGSGEFTTETCSFDIVVTQEVVSTISTNCPSDQTFTILPGTTSLFYQWAAPSATTNCTESSEITVTQSMGEPSGSFFDTGQNHIIEYTFTDECGSTTTCDFDINFIEEALEYEINCPTNISRLIPSNEIGVIVDYDLPTITSNCPTLVSNITLISGAESGSFFGIGTTTLTYQIDFDCGSGEFTSETCSFDITVAQEVVTAITTNCPSAQTITVDPGATTALVTWDEPTASTNCTDGSDVTITQTMGSPNGSVLSTDQEPIIEYTFTDACGTMTTCSFPILFVEIDFEYQIDCPSDITQTVAEGVLGTIVNYNLPTATSNCAEGEIDITLLSGPVSGSFFDIGTTSITYQIEISCGLDQTVTETCTFEIEIQEEVSTECVEELDDFTFMGTYEGHNYFKSNFILTWEEAQLFAEMQDGYLVSINDAAENEFVRSNITQISFIGLTDAAEEGVLEWASEEGVSYSNVENENSPSRDYGTIKFWNGAWGFEERIVQKPFVIEIPCDGGGSNTDYELVCPSDITITIPAGATEGVAIFDEPTVNTDCPIVLVGSTSELSSGDVFPLGMTELEYVIDIDCVEEIFSETCSFTVTLEEDTSVDYEVNCPSDVTITIPEGATEGVAIFDEPTVTTDCPIVLIGELSELTSGDVFPLGTTELEYVIDIDCVDEIYSEDCSFTVTLEEESAVECVEELDDFTFMGTHEGHNYFRSNFILTWEEAQALAAMQGAYLASINDDAENEFIKNNITQISFIGLTDASVEGAFQWASGEGYAYSNIEGTNSASADYGTINFWNGRWAFESEVVQKPFVIEIPCSDGGNGGNDFSYEIDCPDDITITAEIDATGALVIYDEPEIGITCEEGAELNVIETTSTESGTMFPIGQTVVSFDIEIICGDETATATCTFTVTVEEGFAMGCGDDLPGYTLLGEFGGSTYYESNFIADWELAQAQAISFGGNLASINSAGENEFIRSNISQISFIGLTDKNTEGDFEWSDGNSFDYNNIESGKNTADKDYGTINFWNGGWGFELGIVNKRYIMEIPCDGSIGQQGLVRPEEIVQNLRPAKINILYPNPATDIIHVNFTIHQEDTPIQLQVFDVLGRLVFEEAIQASIGLHQKDINIQNYERGIYFLKLSTPDGLEEIKRFVKMD